MIALLADYATIASGIALTLSVLFVGYELRVNAKLARASNAQSLVEISTSFITQIMQDRETARFWTMGHADYCDLDEIDRFRYRTLLTWWLIFHENIHFQYPKGLLDKDIYLPWDYGIMSSGASSASTPCRSTGPRSGMDSRAASHATSTRS
jgi:hypothetical protein